MDSRSCRPTNSFASTLSLLSPPTSLRTSLMFPLVPAMIQCPDKTWHSSFVFTSVCIYLIKYLQSKVISDSHVIRSQWTHKQWGLNANWLMFSLVWSPLGWHVWGPWADSSLLLAVRWHWAGTYVVDGCPLLLRHLQGGRGLLLPLPATPISCRVEDRRPWARTHMDIELF